MSRIDPLRRLYNFLSERLSEDDERSLRNLVHCDQLTTRKLERLKSPAEIFIKLEESGHISETDLELLKELLRQIKRPPLVAEVERVEKELKGCQLERVSNESKVKSKGCLGAEGGDVAAGSAVHIEERGKIMISLTKDPYGSTTSIQHHIDKDYSYKLLSSSATGLQEHISSTEGKEDLPQDVRHDQSISSAVYTSATSTHDDEDVILKCQETLRKSYKRLSHILPLPWLDGADSRLKLEDIYTELDLQNSDGTIVHREDIFSCSGDDAENPKRILIEGDPGYGKSTFCKMIAYDWAKNESEYLRNFKLLFLLELKDLQDYHSENKGKESLKSLIFDLVLRGVKERETVWSFIENNQSQVCFIFDGLDEVSSSNLPVYFKQMVQQKWPLLPDCHVIVTSRIIRDVNSKHMYDRKLSIKGLDTEKVELLVQNYLKYHVSKENVDEVIFAERFMQEVRESLSKHILYSLMQSPLNALMLCEIWKQKRELPHFITELYEAIVEYMVRRYCENRIEGHTFYDTEKKQILLFLGKKSHEGLLSGRGQVFLSDDETKSQPHILQLGFLSKPSTSHRGYSFFHRTFQEYFAALYIADLFSTNPAEFADIIDVSEIIHRKCSDTTLVFVAGLLKEKQSKMFEIWYRKMKRFLHLFDPIFILQEGVVVKAEIITLCAKVLPHILIINIADLESYHNKRKLEIIKMLLQCPDIRSDTISIHLSASNPNARKIYNTCRACLKANSRKLEVELRINCDFSERAVTHFLNDFAFASDPYTDDIERLHIHNNGDIDMLSSIPDILDAVSKISAKNHAIIGLPFRLDLIELVLSQLNNTESLHYMAIVFDEHRDPDCRGMPHTQAVQITSKVGKFKICCYTDDLKFKLVNFQRLLERYTPGTGDSVTVNIKIKCDFGKKDIQNYVKNIIDMMTSVDMNELELELLSYAELDIKEICPQIATIMKRLSSISAQYLTIKGFPYENSGLIEKVHAQLSNNDSFKSIHVIFTESKERYKMHIDAELGKFMVCYDNSFVSLDFNSASLYRLISQYASEPLNHLNVRVTCAGTVIGISNAHDILRRMKSVPIDNITYDFSEYESGDLTEVRSRLISFLQTLSQISAKELVLTGLPIGNEDFMTQVHKVILTSKSLGSVMIGFRETYPKHLQEKIEIRAKVGLLDTTFEMNGLNFDLARLQRLLSELEYESTVRYDIALKCDFRQKDVGSFVKNLLTRIKYVNINELTLLVSGYAITRDIHVCVNRITKSLENISAEQVNIKGLSYAYGHMNLITLLYLPLRKNIAIKKVCIGFTVYPEQPLALEKTSSVIVEFDKFRIIYESHHLTFNLQSLYDFLSHQESLKNEKISLSIIINCDFNDRALDSYMKDAIVNMKSVSITQVTLNISNFTIENARHIETILTNIAQVNMQALLIIGMPFYNVDVLKKVGEPFTKLMLNTFCYVLSGPTCPSYCKLNLLQHSTVIAYCKACLVKLRICENSCDMASFHQRFLQICSCDKKDVITEAHVSYDGNRQQVDFDVRYLLAGSESLKFKKVSFLDRCNYNKLSVESRNTIDVLKTVVAVNSEIIHYENCPSVNFEFAKSVLDIMLRSKSSQVVISFREKMNRSRILGTIKSLENDGLVIYCLKLTRSLVSVQGKYTKSSIAMSMKGVILEFAIGHTLNQDFPRNDTSPFQEQYDLPNFTLKMCGIKSSGNTIGKNQTKAITVSTLCQYVSAFVHLTEFHAEVSLEENIQCPLSEIMTKESLRTINLKGRDLNKIARCIIDCVKERDKVRKIPLMVVLCNVLDSANVSMLTESLETDGFIKSASRGQYSWGWRGGCVKILFIACIEGETNPVTEEFPLVKTELNWYAFNARQRHTYTPGIFIHEIHLNEICETGKPSVYCVNSFVS